MRWLLLVIAFAILAIATPLNAQIWTVTTTDTCNWPLMAIDTPNGIAVDIAAGDSLYVTVTSPNGTVVYSDSLVMSASAITSRNWVGHPDAYFYHALTSTLDGAGATYGPYSVLLTVWDVSLHIPTDIKVGFYKVATNLNTTLARLDEAISGLDDNPWNDATRTLTSIDSTIIAASMKALMARVVWREDTTGYNATAGSFGKANSGLNWADISDVENWLFDSLPGYGATPGPGGLKSFTRQRKYVNVDTLWTGLCLNSDCSSKDTTAYEVFWHTGGSAGGTPDSTRWYLH